MEEPDGDPVIFQAIVSSGDVPPPAFSKKEQKKANADRLRARKSTPRPILKGCGKKRLNLSPSPRVLQLRKKQIAGEREFQGESKCKLKKNLLDVLNEVASPLKAPALDSEPGSEDGIPEGEGTGSPVASPRRIFETSSRKFVSKSKGEGTSKNSFGEVFVSVPT